MGHGQMLSVSIVDRWLARQRVARPARPGQRECVIIRSGGSGLPERLNGQPGEQARGQRAGDGDCGWSGRDQRPGGSGPSSGTRALRLHLVMIPAGTRGEPHRHVSAETAICLVSGEIELWHGDGLAKRSLVRAGDFLSLPPGALHLTVNRGAATAIAVAARAGQPGPAATVPVELPGHLAALRDVPLMRVPLVNVPVSSPQASHAARVSTVGGTW